MFRSQGVVYDPFSTYSESALYAALQSALPAGMSGTLTPSTNSKGQSAVLVRAQASDINAMYDLRSQVSYILHCTLLLYYYTAVLVTPCTTCAARSSSDEG